MTVDPDFLNLLLDHLPVFVYWKNRQFVFQGCNKRYAVAAGLSSTADIIGLTDYTVQWPKKDADFYRLCDERIIEYARAEQNIIESMLHADGRRLWLRTSKTVWHDKDGSVCGLLGISEDITEQITIDEKLRHYEVMASSVGDMLAIVSPDYRFLAVNDAYCAAYARPREEIIGRMVGELINDKLFTSTMKHHVDRALGGTIAQFEGWRVFPGLGERHIKYTYYPVFNDTEKVIGLVAQVHDNTQAKRLETQLIQSQKMEAIGRFAGGIAHDFNNILSIINGYSDICLYGMATDNPYRTKIQQISEAGTRAAQLTQQLLGFSRKQIIQPRLLDLGKELSVLKRMLTRLIGEGISINTIVEDDLWYVNMDRSQFEQILLNLVVNARDAMDASGSVTISIANRRVEELFETGSYAIDPGDYVLITCTDNGTGMPPEIQARIFEPFFTTKPKGVGTGFGLSTVYGIVKQNSGFITVESTIGSGSTFHIMLPSCSGSDMDIQPHPGEAPDKLPHGSETILLAEDDHALRTMCVMILRDLGYTVIEAGNGKEAVRTAQLYSGTIDLLLTDVMMPEMNGPDAAVQISEIFPRLSVLFMSGYAENLVVGQGVLIDGVQFLQKPVTPRRLAHAVRNCLDISVVNRSENLGSASNGPGNPANSQ